jgi:predicted transcriptional regulator
MKVENILQVKGSQVVTIEPEASMSIVIHRLMSMGIGAVVVSKDGVHVNGLISERDVVDGLNKHKERVVDMKARDIMSRDVPVCSADDSIKRVMSQMTTTRSRHLPVVRNGELYGIISIGDVVKHRLEEMELEASVLRDHYIASQ